MDERKPLPDARPTALPAPAEDPRGSFSAAGSFPSPRPRNSFIALRINLAPRAPRAAAIRFASTLCRTSSAAYSLLCRRSISSFATDEGLIDS